MSDFGRPIVESAFRPIETSLLPAVESTGRARRPLTPDKRFGTVDTSEPWQPPPFDEGHVIQLRGLGLSDEEIETLRREVDAQAARAVTAASRGAFAVKLTKERQAKQSEDLLAARQKSDTRATAEERFGDLGLPPFPGLPGGRVASEITKHLERRRERVLVCLKAIIAAEKQLEEARKAAAHSPLNIARGDLRHAGENVEIANAKLDLECIAYREALASFTPDRLEKVSELDSLLPSLETDAFALDLQPLTDEAHQAFRAFADACRRIRARADETESLRIRAMALSKQLGIPVDSGLVPHPIGTGHQSYLDTSLGLVSQRCQSETAEQFLAGSLRGFRVPGGPTA